MTKDNGCIGSYSVSGYTRADGTEVSGYTRTCGAAHNSSNSSTSSKFSSNPQLDDEEKMKQRAELLYPTMKDNKQENSEISSKNAFILQELGLNNEDYELSGNTISKKNQVKEQRIDGIKYPLGSGIEEVEIMRMNAQSEFIEKYNIENEKFLKSNAKLEQFGIDNSKNFIINNLENIPFLKEAVKNLQMSKTDLYLNTDYARQHKIFSNYKEAPNVLQDYFESKIIEQVGEDKLNIIKGILIDEYSESSESLKQNLLSDAEFLNKLKTYNKALKYGYSINDSLNLKGFNWHNAVGFADIRDMHININGNIELYIADVYDFNVGEKNNLVRVGYDRQEKGEITPYFYAYRVIIPQEELKWFLHNYNQGIKLMEKIKNIIPKRTIILFFILAICYMLFDGLIFLIYKNPNICKEPNFFSLLMWEFLYFIPAILAIIINKIVEKKNFTEEKIAKKIKILFYVFSFILVIYTFFIALGIRIIILLFGDV